MAGKLEEEIEARVAAMGYEVVDLERAGSRSRPVLRLRIDVAGPEGGVGLDDCARVSRGLEEFLDSAEGLSERYVLEVSSPGVERPLVRRRDWQRFVGREVAVVGGGPLAGRDRRLEGELVGVEPGASEEEDLLRLRLRGGDEVEISRGEVTRAHLVFRWDEGG